MYRLTSNGERRAFFPEDSALYGAPATVTTLQQLNASAATTVYYPLKKHQIRVVTIHAGGPDDPVRCSVAAVSKKRLPEYEALSYVWGSQENPKHILLNEVDWLVTQNLHSALLRLRHLESDRTVWIDALAINQSDIPERNAQVLKMRTIYSRATHTLVWLGCMEDYKFAVYFKLISFFIQPAEYGNFLKEFNRFPSKSSFSFLEGVMKVTRMEYWTRVWVAQEIMYSKKATILYGKQSLSYSGFHTVLKSLYEVLDDLLKMKWEINETEVNFSLKKEDLKRCGPLSLPDLGAGVRGEYLSLSAWQHLVQDKKATDPKDRVFAYHGCFYPNVRRQIHVDYSRNITEILTQTTLVLIKEDNTLNVLFTGEKFSHHLPCPTWIPGIGEGNHIRTLYIHFKSSGWDLPFYYRFIQQSGMLHVKGKLLATIKDIAPPMAPLIGDGTEDLSHSTRVNTILEHQLRLWEHFGYPKDELGAFDFSYAYHPHLCRRFPGFCWLYVHYQYLLKNVRWLLDPCYRHQYTPYDAWVTVYHHAARRMFSAIGEKGALKHIFPHSGNLYGMGPQDIQPGDKIFFIQGCFEPVILREDSNGHSLIGKAFFAWFKRGQSGEGWHLPVQLDEVEEDIYII